MAGVYAVQALLLNLNTNWRPVIKVLEMEIKIAWGKVLKKVPLAFFPTTSYAKATEPYPSGALASEIALRIAI